jgi:hypothetical protein
MNLQSRNSMKIFKNIKERMNSDGLAQKIAGNIVDRQSRIANYLNGKTRHLSGKRLLLALIGFCVVFGSYCLYLLIHAIN